MSNETISTINTDQNHNFNFPCGGQVNKDHLDTVAFGATIIWVGILLLAANFMTIFDPLGTFFFGAGIIVSIGIGIRYITPKFYRNLTSDYIWAGILFFLGGWYIACSIIVICFGLTLLNSYFKSNN
jgi:hypothetical protein